MSLSEVIEDLSGYIEHELDEGRVAVEVSREVVDELGQAPLLDSSPLGGEDKGEGAIIQSSPGDYGSLEELSRAVVDCKKCSLHETRTKAVPGQGSSSPEIMFIGEAPGADEDRQGLAFVGRAGKLLTKMIEAMGYKREEVFIGNILKCRPPENRAPIPEEMQTCIPYLKEQIVMLKPKVIIALGATAVKGLLETNTGISKLRGKWMVFEGIDLMPTYHPAYLLRNPSAKHDVWEDLKEVLRHLGRKPPPVKKAG